MTTDSTSTSSFSNTDSSTFSSSLANSSSSSSDSISYSEFNTDNDSCTESDSTLETDSDFNNEPEITSCPSHVSEIQSTDSDTNWTSYDPDPNSFNVRDIGEALFHGNQTCYLEDVEPSPETGQIQQECCFFNESGSLIDENSEYAGIGGTANHYSDSWNHTVKDPGGIWHSGREAFSTSMEYYADSIYEDSLLEDVVEGAEEMYDDSLLEDAVEEAESW